MFTRIDSSTGFWYIGAASIVLSLGSAPLFTLTNDLIIGTAPPERAGAAAGLSETAAEFGGALGIAIFGSIGLALYRNGVADVLPAGLPAGAIATAKDTLGGALEVAARLPERVGAALIDGAREAFTRGLHVATVVSAVGAVLLALFVYLMLRRIEPAAEDETAEAAGALAIEERVQT
jgi:DHA2 family multidrug resistance protein-like MFS transporter